MRYSECPPPSAERRRGCATWPSSRPRSRMPRSLWSDCGRKSASTTWGLADAPGRHGDDTSRPSGRKSGFPVYLQLVGDAFLSPGGVICRHLAERRLEVPGQARSARRLGLPTPKEAESLAVPTQERVGLDIQQRVAPREPLTQGRHHPAGGLVGPPRPDLPLLEQGQLLSQEKVLGHQRRPRTCGEGDQLD